MKNLLFRCFITVLLVATIIQGKALSEIIIRINRIKSPVTNIPILIVKPDKGYVVIWQEAKKHYWHDDTSFFYLSHEYYCEFLDTKCHVLFSKQELSPRWDSWARPISLNKKSVVWLDPERLLLVVWQMLESTTPTYRLESMVLNTTTGAIEDTDTSELYFYECEVFSDNRGSVYAVDFQRWTYNARIAQVYPEYGEVNEVNAIESSILTEDHAALLMKNGNLLLCYRLYTTSDSLIPGVPKHWWGMPNNLVYFIVDLNGNIVTKPVMVDITRDAFRKTSGIYLDGEYEYYPEIAVRGGLDLSQLPSGHIILSVTGTDMMGELCTYQVKINGTSDLIKSPYVDLMKVQSFPKNKKLPVSKILPAILYEEDLVTGETKKRIEYVHFGFDEEGNFYSSRYLWRENIK